MFNKKRQYFKKMLSDAERTLWELEFSKFRTQGIREQIRRQYDQAKQALGRIEEALKGDEKNETLLKDKESVERNIATFKAQIDDMDLRISGALPSEIYPEGVVGTAQKIDNIVETRSYLQAFLKKHC